MKMLKHAKKPKKVFAKSGKPKGKTHRQKSEGTIAVAAKPMNKDIYNKADDSYERMIGNKGIPRKRIAMVGRRKKT